MGNSAICPSCGHAIEREHNGKEGNNEYTDPWEFVEHQTDDVRGDTVYRRPCMGSGRNVTMARISL